MILDRLYFEAPVFAPPLSSKPVGKNKMSLSTVKNRYYEIARKLKAPSIHVRFATTPKHDGGPHIEYEGSELHYVITERGSEFERRKTKDPNEVLFWLVSDLTWAMASDWELANRIEGEDSRIQLFRKDVDLMSLINEDWANRKKVEYEKLLSRKYPFGRSE